MVWKGEVWVVVAEPHLSLNIRWNSAVFGIQAGMRYPLLLSMGLARVKWRMRGMCVVWRWEELPLQSAVAEYLTARVAELTLI